MWFKSLWRLLASFVVSQGRMLGTAPLGGWKVPYDGPVDTNFAISVDRRIALSTDCCGE